MTGMTGMTGQLFEDYGPKPKIMLLFNIQLVDQQLHRHTTVQYW